MISSRLSKPVLAVCGPSGAGKTTWIRALLPELRARAISTAVVKMCHHDPDIEPDRKDSAVHLKAGARQVLLLSPDKKAILENRSDASREEEIVTFAENTSADLVIVEGARSSQFPKIAVLITKVVWDIDNPYPIIARVGNPPIQSGMRDWSDPRAAAKEIGQYLIFDAMSRAENSNAQGKFEEMGDAPTSINSV